MNPPSDTCSGIHKLPPELLLRIFQAGEASERAAHPKDQSYLGLQDIATQVCGRWRNLAIGCPTLWTYIHVTRPSARALARLYLARAGPGTLLDLDIKIQRGWCEGQDIGYDDWDSQRVVVQEFLEFLSSHGATVNRWKTLDLCSPEPGVLLGFIGTLSTETAPALRFLSCRLCHHGRSDKGRYLSRQPQHPKNAYQLSPFIVPKFKFDRLSWCCVFDRSSPVFSGLTELRFTSWPSRCSPSQLQALLLLNPQLELLSLGTSDLYKWEILREIEFFIDVESVRMVQLHTLSVETIKDLFWVIGVLKLIDAPVLKKLSIAAFVCTEKQEAEVQYLCRLPCGPRAMDEEGDSTLGKPRYPYLNELDIHNFFHREHVIDMLTSWPSITKLHASRAQAALLEDSSLLPQLSYLKIHFKAPPQLCRILSWRKAAGLPIQEVDLPFKWRDEVVDELPSGITVREHDPIDFEVESNDSMTEAEFSVEDESGRESSTEDESGSDSWVTGESDSDSGESELEGDEWVWSVYE
ncbi:unnamed protein product [Rhizoctonia solani]|uniref:F-box domain-containing protein n=1 Tax=Rhizoctonia solani TaxID=456999 RepID=A0A8H3HTB3_9AGAM|nr:unnamed protein product [Rhizoctonia solani]